MKLMNFIKDPILIIAAIVLFVTACNKDKVDYEQPFIKVNPSTLNVESAASEQIISVNSNRDWTVEIISDAETSWISSNLKQGEAGTVELKLSILSNDGYDREATIKIKTSTLYEAVRIIQKGAKKSEGVKEFKDDFSSITDPNVAYASKDWTFYSSDADVANGFKTGTFTNTQTNITDKYIQIAPFKSSNATVTAFAKMPSLNVAEASTKMFSFALAWYAKTPDNSKFEVVVSQDFTGDFTKAKWDIVKDATPAANAPYNDWNIINVDLSAYSTSKNLHIAFRFTGKANTYRLDDVKFGYKAEATVKTGAAGDITKTSATISANTYTAGSDAITEVGVAIKTSGEYIYKSAASVSSPFQVALSGLTANTTYTFAAYVKVGGQYILGEASTFTTLSDYTEPTTVKYFKEDFSTIKDANVAFSSEQWVFFSTDSDVKNGFKTGVYNTDKYIQIAPFNSTLNTVSAYAMLAPLNIKDADSKKLTFSLAWYYKTADASKFEVVVSENFKGDFNSATWTVVKDATFASSDKTNTWVDHSVDLSAYAAKTKIYLAFRYTGKANTYRLDNIEFGAKTDDPSKAVLKSISDIRALKSLAQANKNTYTIPDNWKIKGVVVSDKDVANVNSKSLVIQDGTNANSGITVRFTANHSFAKGDEVEVELMGGKLTIYSGQLQVQATADDKVTKVATGKSFAPKSISVADLKTGNYEGMYVQIADVQAQADFVGKKMYDSQGAKGNVKMISGTEEFMMYSTSYSTFKDELVPSGKGILKGLGGIFVTTSATNYQIQPQGSSDFAGLK